MAGSHLPYLFGGIMKLITEEFEQLFEEYPLYLKESEDLMVVTNMSF
jgi:hypothetical protein